MPHSRPSRGTPSLDTWAKKWSTPTVNDAETDFVARKHTKGGRSLGADLSEWPTPAARDEKGTNSRPLNARRKGSKAGEQLPNFVKHKWTTPTASDATGAKRGSAGKRTTRGGPAGRKSIANDASQWATPTVGDSVGAGSRNVEGSKAHAGVSLSDMVTTGDSKGRGGKLNKPRTAGRPDRKTPSAGIDGSPPEAQPLLFKDV